MNPINFFAKFKYKRKLFHTRRSYATKVETNALKVLFFGTDTFSLPSLKVLHKHNSYGDVGVVTSFKSPANCVRVYAEKQQLPLHKWPINTEICKPYDLGVVVSFGHLIPTPIIKAFPLGMINVHASLLPRWRGAAPIIYAIMNGDKETGVSIMRIEPKRFDIGDIFAQKSVLIKPGIFMPELHQELSVIGGDLLWHVISSYPQSFESPIKQSDERATYAPKVTSAITEIDWNHWTALEVYNRHRALYTFRPLSSKLHTKSIELLEINLPTATVNCHSESPPGSVVYNRERKCLRVQCADCSFVEVSRLRVEGRKAMTAVEFNNGFLKKLQKSEMAFHCNKRAVCC